MKAVSVLILASVLCGCGIARQMEAEENAKRADAALVSAQASCESQAKSRELKGLLGYTECHNQAHAAWWRTRGLPHYDLLQLKQAKKAALAAEFDRGRIDITQLKLANAEIDTEVVSALEQRTAVRDHASAALMQASAAQQMAGPRTCHAFGNSVTCY